MSRDRHKSGNVSVIPCSVKLSQSKSLSRSFSLISRFVHVTNCPIIQISLKVAYHFPEFHFSKLFHSWLLMTSADDIVKLIKEKIFPGPWNLLVLFRSHASCTRHAANRRGLGSVAPSLYRTNVYYHNRFGDIFDRQCGSPRPKARDVCAYRRWFMKEGMPGTRTPAVSAKRSASKKRIKREKPWVRTSAVLATRQSTM